MPVQSAMCDSFQGFSNFCWAELGIDPILCKQHATRKTLSYIYLLGLFLIQWQAGVAAKLQYSHAKYFPNQDAYSEYYDFVVDILGWRASRPVLRLCWLTTCASTMGM